MKTIKINKKSWHYRLIDKYTPEAAWLIDNFCDYFQGVVLGMVSVCIIIVCGSVLSYMMIVDPILYAITGFDPIFLDGNDLLKIGAAIWVVVLFIFLAAFFNTKVQQYKTYKIDKPDSFVYTAYKSFKDKVCFKIEYEQENNDLHNQ